MFNLASAPFTFCSKACDWLQKMILLNIKEGNLFKQEDLIIIKEGSSFVLFWHVGFFVPLECTKVCS
jgi:hypothetical protein